MRGILTAFTVVFSDTESADSLETFLSEWYGGGDLFLA